MGIGTGSATSPGRTMLECGSQKECIRTSVLQTNSTSVPWAIALVWIPLPFGTCRLGVKQTGALFLFQRERLAHEDKGIYTRFLYLFPVYFVCSMLLICLTCMSMRPSHSQEHDIYTTPTGQIHHRMRTIHAYHSTEHTANFFTSCYHQRIFTT